MNGLVENSDEAVTFVNNARIGNVPSQRVSVLTDNTPQWTKRLNSITVDDATAVMQANLQDFLNIEIDKYIASHQQAYGLSDDELTALHARIVKSTYERKQRLSSVPLVLFLSMVAGYLGYDGPGRLLEHDTMQNDDAVRALADEYVAEVAEGGGSGVPGSEMYMNFVDSSAVSGLVKPSAPVTSAVSAVMSELRSKRGCLNLAEYDVLIENATLRAHLAELTAYQMMLFRQVNPKRDHKVIEYTRIQSLMDNTWTKFYMALKRHGGRYGFKYIPPRTHFRSYDHSF